MSESNVSTKNHHSNLVYCYWQFCRLSGNNFYLNALFLLLQEFTSDSEWSEDEIEPKLKYVRLNNDLKKLLNNTSATCIAVHTKVGIVMYSYMYLE